LKNKTELAASSSRGAYDNPIRSRIWTLGAAAAAALLAILLPHFLELPKPYVITFIGVAVCLITIAFAIVQRPAMQNVCVLLASVWLCLTIGELGTWFLNASGPQMIDTLEFADDPDLGYGLQANQRAQAREVYRRKVLFDVTYTIDENGLRVIPTAAPLAQCRVAFFGDSFTFGWGLADAETMPNQFVATSGGLYRAYNFAQSGYGPHQMLRMLETGRFGRVVGDGPIDLVVYQGIVDHVARVVGRNTWDLRGPRYVMRTDKPGIEYVGSFHDSAYVALLEWLKKSEMYPYFTSRFFDDQVRVEDLPLYIAILKQAQWEVERRYGVGSFIILFWYDERLDAVLMTEHFKKAGLNVISIERIIPDINENGAAYRLAQVDTHPNALANHKIAEFLAHTFGPQHCHVEDSTKNAARQ
jgi:hypothetical protein